MLVNLVDGRTPHGVRGLKDRVKQISHGVRESHPSRGAWIERSGVRSSRTAVPRRTPHGVRGLKDRVELVQYTRKHVAPLTGCVD